MSPHPTSSYVNLAVSDGTSMRAYTVRPPGEPAGALLVFQEAFGVNAHIRDVAERYAREGYLAIAPELFHRTAPGLEAGYDDFPAVQPYLQALTDPSLTADIEAARLWLHDAAPGLPAAAVGYCMGGRTACLAALTVPLTCAVSYYGGGIAPRAGSAGLLGRFHELGAPMLFVWGGRDQHIGPEAVRAVTTAAREAAKSYVNAEFSDAGHGFFCDARPAYHAASAAQAWALTLAFLRSHR